MPCAFYRHFRQRRLAARSAGVGTRSPGENAPSAARHKFLGRQWWRPPQDIYVRWGTSPVFGEEARRVKQHSEGRTIARDEERVHFQVMSTIAHTENVIPLPTKKKQGRRAEDKWSSQVMKFGYTPLPNLLLKAQDHPDTKPSATPVRPKIQSRGE